MIQVKHRFYHLGTQKKYYPGDKVDLGDSEKGIVEKGLADPVEEDKNGAPKAETKSRRKKRTKN